MCIRDWEDRCTAKATAEAETAGFFMPAGS
jgi:hypothetical protein